MDLDLILQVFERFGWEGVGAIAFVLCAIFLLQKLGVVGKDGQAQLANIVLASVLSGLAASPSIGNGIEAFLIAAGSAFLFKFIRWLNKQQAA